MALTPRVGFHETATPAATTTALPGAQYGREFIAGQIAPQDLRGKFEKLAAPWTAGGGGAYISFKPQLADVSAGKWDTYLSQLGVWLRDYPTVAVIVWHEPEDDMAGTQFAALFNRARAGIKNGWTGARVAYAAMAYQWRPNGKAANDPGFAKAEADEYLCDVYSGVSFPTTAILPTHAGYTGWYNKIVLPRLAAGEVVYGVAERGFQGDPKVVAATIQAEADWLRQQVTGYDGSDPLHCPPSVYLAWSTAGTEGDTKWVWDDQSRALFAQIVSALAPTAVDPQWQAGYDQGLADGKAQLEQVRAQARKDAFSEMAHWLAGQLGPA
jgi:hypothetical protein